MNFPLFHHLLKGREEEGGRRGRRGRRREGEWGRKREEGRRRGRRENEGWKKTVIFSSAILQKNSFAFLVQ